MNRHSVATLGMIILGVGLLAAAGARYWDSAAAGIAALWAVFGICNVYSFAAFAYDKQAAPGDVSQRISEVDLLWTIILCGEAWRLKRCRNPWAHPPPPAAGPIGGWVGMLLCRHKVRKQSFVCWAILWTPVRTQAAQHTFTTPDHDTTTTHR